MTKPISLACLVRTPRPLAQALLAYKPVITVAISRASDHVFLLSAEDAHAFISACENPPAATTQMHDLASEVAEWFR